MNKEKKIKENILETHKKMIETYWDYERNNKENLFPENFVKGSHQKVWWKCEECGKSFEREITYLLKNKNYYCKVCISKKNRTKQLEEQIKKEGSFQDKYPELMIFWDWEENNKEQIYPDKIVSGSTIKANFICEKNHKWKSCINKFVKSTKCPYCTNKKVLSGFNDFETWCIKNNKKYLLDEWDYELNTFTPKEILPFSSKKVNWIKTVYKNDKKFVLKWVTEIQNRSMGKNCPYTSNPPKKVLSGFNDFETWCKENNKEYLLDEWDYELNTFTPKEILPFSNKYIYWNCSDCHNIFKMTLSNRVSGKDCPCKKSKKISQNVRKAASLRNPLTNSTVIEEWDYELNFKNNIFPENYSDCSKKIVYWKCKNCNKSWKDSIEHKKKGVKCPHCSISKGEQRIKDFLDKNNIIYKQQYSFQNCKYKNSLRFDFAIFSKENELKYLIEFDGEQHFIPIDFAGRGENFALETLKINQEKDKIKDTYCKNNEIKLIRITYKQMEEIEEILKNIE